MTQPTSSGSPSGRQRPVAKPAGAPTAKPLGQDGSQTGVHTRGVKSAATGSGISRPGAGAVAGAKGASSDRVPTNTNAGIKSPGRQHTSDRQTGGRAAPARPKGASGVKMSLRGKFMLVMAGVTALALVFLGLAMAKTTNRYLLGQKQQDGIETARMAAQLAVVMKDRITLARNLAIERDNNDFLRTLQQEVQKRIAEVLEDARSWNGSTRFTDLEAIRFDCPDVPELAGSGVGDDEGVSGIRPVTSIFIPKEDVEIAMPAGIEVYTGRKRYASGLEKPILRFKIALPKGFGGTKSREGGLEPANVRVDVAMASVDKVAGNLTFTIFLAVVLAIAVVLGIAHWLASSITKPLEQLVRDMAVVSKGNLGHRTNAKSGDEIGVLATEFNKMTESLQAAQAAVIEQEKAAYELSLAREVQQQLLPAQPPLITGFVCDSFYQGAKAVSGDYFDFIPLADGLWGFIIADVSGKGIPGSMVMAVTRTVVRLVAPRHGKHAAETLKDTNRLIARQIKRGMFVTSFYAVLDESTGELTYASAGHNPMVIYRAANRSAELATTKGIALGFNEGPVFDRTIQEAKTQLGKSDALVLYTDGFPEAMNGSNEEFGEENFYKLIAANGHLESSGLIKAVVEGIARHRGDAEQSDDLTMLTVRRS